MWNFGGKLIFALEIGGPQKKSAELWSMIYLCPYKAAWFTARNHGGIRRVLQEVMPLDPKWTHPTARGKSARGVGESEINNYIISLRSQTRQNHLQMRPRIIWIPSRERSHIPSKVTFESMIFGGICDRSLEGFKYIKIRFTNPKHPNISFSKGIRQPL